MDKLTIFHYASLTNSGKMSQTTFCDFKGIFPGKSTVCLPDTMIVASAAAFNKVKPPTSAISAGHLQRHELA